MSSFSEDKKWLEAKQVVGQENSWVDIISYYRHIGGKSVFVYTVGDGDKKLIIDYIDDDNILLLNKQEELEVDTYDNVTNSRKVFEYSEDFENKTYTLNKYVSVTIPVQK